MFSGLSGIAFSRFFLDIHPNSNLSILESDTCVGGVWSACESTYELPSNPFLIAY